MNIKRSLEKLFIKDYIGRKRVIINLYHTYYSKHVLISYIITPFENPNTFTHQNYITSHIVAETFRDLGYNVDVVDYQDNESKIDYLKYDVIFGMGDNFERSFFCQNRKIPRIHLITGAHDDFHNAMSLKSIEDFYQLSGLWLTTEANVSNSCNYYALYNADLGIILAHGYVFEEYKKRFVNKLYTLNNNILGVFSGLKLKTAETRTNNFLFLSGGKQITKGFHLLMEVAKQRKDLSFYVVVPHINDLLLNYYQDLLIPESNVILFKNLRMDSKQMLDIIETCSYSIAPSYVDGLPGGTIEPMSAGLIPIVSKNCGFPDEKFIIEMQDLTSASLHQAIDRVLQLSDAEYVELSNMAKQYALEKYSAENVKIELEDILKSALNGS
jgi:glycosyltransferase involved in cell wall biosynthesis